MKLDGIVSDGVMLAILHGLSPVLKNFFDKTK
jgi:hypothetical protein